MDRIASARATWWSYGWAGAYYITICTADRRHFFGQIVNGVMVLSPTGELAQKFWFEIPNHAYHVELGAFQVMPNHVHGILILQGQMGNCGSGLVPERGTNTWSVSIPSVGLDPVPGIEPAIPIDPGMVIPATATGPAMGIVSAIPIDPGMVIPATATGPAMGIVSAIPIDPGRDKACLVSTGETATPPEPQPSPQSLSHARFQNQGKNTISSMIGGYKSAVTRYAHRSVFTFDWQSRFHDHIIRNDEEYQRINDYIETNPQRWHDDRFFTYG